MKLTISEAIKLIFNREGVLVCTKTVKTWIDKGLRRNGESIRLPASRVGARWFVTEEDLLEFLKKTAREPEGKST